MLITTISKKICHIAMCSSKICQSLVHTSSVYLTKIEEQNPAKSFQELLDESRLMKFGRAPGKCVIGKITYVCNNDLYVDFGGKFEAVVSKPEVSEHLYTEGSKVRLILNKFEMTGAFLGDDRHITLCEADAVLIGPYHDIQNDATQNTNNLNSGLASD